MHEFNSRPVLLNLIGGYARVSYWDASEFVCPRGVCSLYLDGQRLYWDPDHLSYAGARMIGHRIVMASGVPPVFSVMRARACPALSTS